MIKKIILFVLCILSIQIATTIMILMRTLIQQSHCGNWKESNKVKPLHISYKFKFCWIWLTFYSRGTNLLISCSRSKFLTSQFVEKHKTLGHCGRWEWEIIACWGCHAPSYFISPFSDSCSIVTCIQGFPNSIKRYGGDFAGGQNTAFS